MKKLMFYQRCLQLPRILQVCCEISRLFIVLNIFFISNIQISIPSDLNDFKRVNFNVSVQYVHTFNLFSE